MNIFRLYTKTSDIVPGIRIRLLCSYARKIIISVQITNSGPAVKGYVGPVLTFVIHYPCPHVPYHLRTDLIPHMNHLYRTLQFALMHNQAMQTDSDEQITVCVN